MQGGSKGIGWVQEGERRCGLAQAAVLQRAEERLELGKQVRQTDLQNAVAELVAKGGRLQHVVQILRAAADSGEGTASRSMRRRAGPPSGRHEYHACAGVRLSRKPAPLLPSPGISILADDAHERGGGAAQQQRLHRLAHLVLVQRWRPTAARARQARKRSVCPQLSDLPARASSPRLPRPAHLDSRNVAGSMQGGRW